MGRVAISLDSNRSREEQVRWLKSMLQVGPDRWTIMTFHHPIFFSCERPGQPRVARALEAGSRCLQGGSGAERARPHQRSRRQVWRSRCGEHSHGLPAGLRSGDRHGLRRFSEWAEDVSGHQGGGGLRQASGGRYAALPNYIGRAG